MNHDTIASDVISNSVVAAADSPLAGFFIGKFLLEHLSHPQHPRIAFAVKRAFYFLIVLNNVYFG